MSKHYGMREMKSIVEYLVQHNAYSEIKGRRMWMDFANSSLTNRTWQSLKETFLKRILPDIHNPYYKLSVEEISSFKQSRNLTSKNKLTIQAISDSSGSEIQRENEDSKHGNKEDELSGEDTNSSSTVHRQESTGNVNLETEAEAINDNLHKELNAVNSDNKDDKCTKSTKNIDHKSEEATVSKSFRDFITYSEPLTPMLQEVVDDFVTDEEDDLPMKIVEDAELDPNNENLLEILSSNNNKDTSNSKNTEPDQLSKQVDTKNEKLDTDRTSLNTINKSLTLKKKEKPPVNNESNSHCNVISSNVNENDTESQGIAARSESKANANDIETEKSIITLDRNEESVQNYSHTTSDTFIPNNQEALLPSAERLNQVQNEISETEELLKTTVFKNISRARANSSETNGSKKKLETGEEKTLRINKNASTNRDCETVDLTDLANENVVEEDTDLVLTKNDNAKSQDGSNVQNTVTVDNNRESNENIPLNNLGNRNNDSEYSALVYQSMKSGSLHTEADSPTKHINGSVSNSNIKDTKKDAATNPACNIDKVIVLKSHSESESTKNDPTTSKTATACQSQKNKCLANLFGFSSGAATKKRNRKPQQFHRKIPHHSKHKYSSGVSSEWSSDDDSDYVSPPGEQCNQNKRKYLKPKTGHVFPLEPEGGLCVMYGNKVYPIVTDDGILKRYVTYTESDSEEDKAYWKAKYIEEKNKNDALKSLMEDSKGNKRQRNEQKNTLAVPQKKSRRSTTTEEEDQTDEINVVAKEPEKQHQKTEKNHKKTLKIKFCKNNEKVELEGHWPEIHPVLEQVVDIFHKNEQINETKPEEIKPKQVNATKPKEINKTKPREVNKTKSKEVSEAKPKEMSEARPKDVSEAKPNKISENKPQEVNEIEPRKRVEKVISVDSRISSPLLPFDEETHEKVAQLEREIFKEIEEKADIDSENKISDKGSETSETMNNITLRRKRGRPRKSDASLSVRTESTSTSVSTQTPTKKSRKSVEVQTSEPQQLDKMSNNEVANKVDAASATPKKKTRLSGGAKKEAVKADENITNNTRKLRKPRADDKTTGNTAETVEVKENTNTKIAKKSRKDIANDTNIDEESEILYKFPSPPPPTRHSRVNANNHNEKKNNKIYCKQPSLFSSPDNSSMNSIESSQGYQDSDISPISMCHKKKKKISINTIVHRKSYQGQRIRKKFFTNLSNGSSSDSSVTSLSSGVYNSESYQILQPQRRRSFRLLEKIDERSSLTSLSGEVPEMNANSETGNSSNLSMPMSLELSIVENLSINNNELNSACDYPTINESQANDCLPEINLNKYVISKVDVSMPLMEQACGFVQSSKLLQEQNNKEISELTIMETKANQANNSIYNITDYNMNVLATSTLPESLLKEMNTVVINNPTLTESLNEKLNDLYLDSAKKSKPKKLNLTKDNKMDVDNTFKIKKRKPKRPSSTPHKQKKTVKSKKSVLKDQIVDSCSYSCRKSCPALTETFHEKDNANSVDTVNIQATTSTSKSRKTNVIKTKIPKRTRKNKENNSLQNDGSDISIQTDAGIQSSTVLQAITDVDSVDLIHNHSDTCLHTNDCIVTDDKLINTDTKSVSRGISWNSPSVHSDYNETNKEMNNNNSVSSELFCNNAQTATLQENNHSPETDSYKTATATLYQSPIRYNSFNSLITEDLSFDAPEKFERATKWFLLSEDETCNTVDAYAQQSKVCDGAILKEIFPITCAVPDLSTITEMSEDNNSMKGKLNADGNMKQ